MMGARSLTVAHQLHGSASVEGGRSRQVLIHAGLPERIEDLQKARNDLQIALTPAPVSVIERALEFLIAAYPSWRPDADYLAPLMNDLAEFSSDAIIAGTTEVRRHARMPPNHAKVLAAVRKHADGSRQMLESIKATIADYESAWTEAERRQATAVRIAAIEDRLSSMGSLAPRPGAYEVAERYLREYAPFSKHARQVLYSKWMIALDDLEPWAVNLIERSVICATVDHCGVPPGRAVQILTAASQDIPGAIEMLDAESKVVPFARLYGSWTYPSSVLQRAVGDAIRSLLSPPAAQTIRPHWSDHG